MKVPRDVSGARCVKALRRLGFVPQRQVGSHLVLFNSASRRTVSVPMHDALRMLLAILEDADVALDEFLEVM